METPKLDLVKKLLTLQLEKMQKDKEKQEEEGCLISCEEVGENYVTTYIEEMSKEIIEINKERYLKELKQLKKQEELKEYLTKSRSLLYEGLIMAFIVGLAVNQVTDLIGLFKGNINFDNKILIWSSVFSTILILGSIVTYAWKFIIETLNYIKSFVIRNKEEE